MRKIMMALPCLLVSGLVTAKEAQRLDASKDAGHVLMASALDASVRNEAPVIDVRAGQLEADKRKSTKKAPAPAPKPVATPTDTSKRFHMTQNGKQMTADDFDAWMKKNGYRVASGAPAAQKQAEPAKEGGK